MRVNLPTRDARGPGLESAARRPSLRASVKPSRPVVIGAGVCGSGLAARPLRSDRARQSRGFRNPPGENIAARDQTDADASHECCDQTYGDRPPEAWLLLHGSLTHGNGETLPRVLTIGRPSRENARRRRPSRSGSGAARPRRHGQPDRARRRRPPRLAQLQVVRHSATHCGTTGFTAAASGGPRSNPSFSCPFQNLTLLPCSPVSAGCTGCWRRCRACRLQICGPPSSVSTFCASGWRSTPPRSS